MVARMRAVSIRMSTADIRAIKKLADRLQARESDVVRYAVKTVLIRLAPLFEDGLHGRHLLPVLMEHSEELMRHFDLDLARLDAMVNGDEPEPSKRIDREDLRIIAMHSVNPSMAKALGPRGALSTTADAVEGSAAGPESFRTALQRYLYGKYASAPPVRGED